MMHDAVVFLEALAVRALLLVARNTGGLLPLF